MDTLTFLYEDYQQQVLDAAAKMRPGDGIFGIGKKLSDDICHDRFVEGLEAYLKEEQNAEPERLFRILEFIYRCPNAYPEAHSSAYWMMLSAHILTLDLIPRLQKEDARNLLDWYQEAYPRSERLPAQVQVIKRLKKHTQTSLFHR